MADRGRRPPPPTHVGRSNIPPVSSNVEEEALPEFEPFGIPRGPPNLKAIELHLSLGLLVGWMGILAQPSSLRIWIYLLIQLSCIMVKQPNRKQNDHFQCLNLLSIFLKEVKHPLPVTL
ncbi:UNVERIFIED_CONTAM: hypothetical protein FKN15_054120 [Acipenser sinensis]